MKQLYVGKCNFYLFSSGIAAPASGETVTDAPNTAWPGRREKDPGQYTPTRDRRTVGLCAHYRSQGLGSPPASLKLPLNLTHNRKVEDIARFDVARNILHLLLIEIQSRFSPAFRNHVVCRERR
jgi:hypothetical protein